MNLRSSSTAQESVDGLDGCEMLKGLLEFLKHSLKKYGRLLNPYFWGGVGYSRVGVG